MPTDGGLSRGDDDDEVLLMWVMIYSLVEQGGPFQE
jgi:hypothetical protein